MTARTPQGPASVTERQREVASLLADGMTNPQIADALGITLDGAKHHVSQLLIRLNLERREEIAIWYREEIRMNRLRLVSLPFLLLLVGVSATAVAIVIGVVVLRSDVNVIVGVASVVATGTPDSDIEADRERTPHPDALVTLAGLREMSPGESDYSCGSSEGGVWVTSGDPDGVIEERWIGCVRVIWDSVDTNLR